jgi:hypothetical protein
MPTKTSHITRIFERLVRESRRTRMITRASLTHGAQLAVLVDLGTITLTIKRQNQPLGERELVTFRRDCGVPEDAEVLTPEMQGTRFIAVRVEYEDGTTAIEQETWRYVTWRWKDEA